MKKYNLMILSLITVCLSCSAEALPENNVNEGGAVSGLVVHTASEMIPSEDEVVLNSHADQEQWSVLQPMYESFTVVPHEYLVKEAITYSDQWFACYPRIKKMASGEYIMFWHGGEFGTRVWCSISSDLKRWSEPKMLYKPENITVKETGKTDVRRYVNMDAVVLPDGEILAVCSYRAAGHYGLGIGGGLKLIRSKDNGRTWSSPQTIYEGPNWEAYLLLLPDQKTIHCYFTDAIPQSRNSGTALIISTDKGATWSEKACVCRQYKYDHYCPEHGSSSGNNCPEDCSRKDFFGQKIYTDQMPCFRVLNDGKTIAGFLEARLETPTNITGTSYCKMSMVYNDGLVWRDLGNPNKTSKSEGPSRRFTNFFKGGSGYMVTFPQGEVVISYNVDQRFKMKVLDRHANGYGGSVWTEGWITPFKKYGYWGSMEVDSPQTLVAAIHGVESPSKGYDGEYNDDEGMQIGRFWVNRRIDALPESIKVDGDGQEWKSRQALYLSSPDKTETIFRAAYDETNLYIISETVVQNGVEPHTLSLGISNETGTVKSFVKITPDGKVSSSGAGLSSYSSCEGVSAEGSRGFVTEFSISLKSLGIKSGDMVCFYAKATTGNSSTSFSLANQDVVTSWQRIVLCDRKN